jgi:hypothetical protein
MSRRRIWSVALLAFATACNGDQLPEPGPQRPSLQPSDSTSANLSARQQSPRTVDEEFDHAARTEVPGFAGYYLAEDGSPIVRLVDARHADAARRFVRARNGGVPGREARVVAAEYDFSQLKGWRDRLQELVGRNGVHMLDVDERTNRVWVGVTDEGAAQALRAAARAAGVPYRALEVAVVPAAEFRADYLTDRFDVLWGGVQIDKTPGYGGECTLGFMADWGWDKIFVTNSHCSQSYFAYDGGTLYQNNAAPGNEIGVELHDRGYWEPCGSLLCRYSDAAYIGRNGARYAPREETYRIATTEFWAIGGPATTKLVSPTQYPSGQSTPVVGRLTDAQLVVGAFMEKIGRTSGATLGQITRSCVQIGRLLCQYEGDIYSAPGDSGSPIRQNDNNHGTLLAGILWGGPTNNYNITYFSPLSGIERDLGAIGVCTVYLAC